VLAIQHLNLERHRLHIIAGVAGSSIPSMLTTVLLQGTIQQPFMIHSLAVMNDHHHHHHPLVTQTREYTVQKHLQHTFRAQSWWLNGQALAHFTPGS
jgi:hypothetical protein